MLSIYFAGHTALSIIYFQDKLQNGLAFLLVFNKYRLHLILRKEIWVLKLQQLGTTDQTNVC